MYLVLLCRATLPLGPPPLPPKVSVSKHFSLTQEKKSSNRNRD